MTPYIESGDIETGQAMALVDWTLLEGIGVSFIEVYREVNIKMKD